MRSGSAKGRIPSTGATRLSDGSRSTPRTPTTTPRRFSSRAPPHETSESVPALAGCVEQKPLADARELGDGRLPGVGDLARRHASLDLLAELGRSRQDVNRQLLGLVLVRRIPPQELPGASAAKRREQRDARLDRGQRLAIRHVNLTAATARRGVLVEGRLE